MTDEGLFKEDAERLARQILDENPMVDILEIKVDPEQGGYVIVAYDRGADEEFVVDRYETWTERGSVVGPDPRSQIVFELKKKKGRSVAVARGKWAQVPIDAWPEEIREALEAGEVPGEPLASIEPSIEEAELVEPGHGSPGKYGFDGSHLSHLSADESRVWRQVMKLANFTLTDQSDHVQQWRGLYFDISPEPLAPMVEPGHAEWSEAGVLEEVRDRLLDISEQGYGAILIGGQVNAAAYAWVLAGKLGLKVITSWTGESSAGRGSLPAFGCSELRHYHDVEESL